MPYLGEEIKKLGFGLMRLPMKDDKIDVEQTKVMVDHFLEAGFTYFDTAWAYAGSEDAIREALVERYPREKFQLATKNAAWINCKTREDAIQQFETSLKQTGAGYFDFYLLHNLGESRTKAFDDFDIHKISNYNDKKIEELMGNKKIIRNRLKIKASINNSKIFKEIQNEYGTFYNYLKDFTNGKTIFEIGKTTSSLSNNISKDLQKRGMKFVGSTIIYTYLQAVGIIYSHGEECFLYKKDKEKIQMKRGKYERTN